MMIHDQIQRERALDPSQSFIVQAPAGSGKTELLVRRYLVLLAHAKKQPEEVLAITFTRKAATEMRQRVINALSLALEPEPKETHLQIPWKLAKKAMDKNQLLNWQILENPNRLRIQTIDSFCHYLVQQMPVTQDFLLQTNLTEDATDIYRQTARALLRMLEEETHWTEKLADLLLHLDNYHITAENLFCEMLKRRDQWLPHIIPFRQQNEESKQNVRQLLELSLKNLCLDHLEKCYQLMPQEYAQELVTLLRFAATALPNIANSFSEDLLICQTLEYLPPPEIDSLSQWQGIARFLLTGEYQWRKKVDKNLGFAKNTPEKEAIQHLLATLANHENLREALENILHTPLPCYTDTQWAMVDTLVEILPILVAQLKITFNQRHEVDYTEISLNALQALGHDEEPSDLTMYLDQQIQHILVDEFQDTSISQFKLLEKLTAAWHPQDNRSLFLVGDPMQSIYRFREAEVGLFLKVQQEGLGHLSLESLHLSCNFRSDTKIVNWINEQFERIFPRNSDITTGAVPFSASQAINATTENADISFHAHLDSENEAINIVHIIHEERRKNPEGTICILVRAKNHLAAIIPQLQAAKLSFSAVEIESLAQQPVVIDLISLSKALLHLSDRVSWFAILRAPWLGLSLNDLLLLSNASANKTIWFSLLNHKSISSFSKHAQKCLPNFVTALSQIFANRQRLPFSDWIRQAWLALGGPFCFPDEVQLQHAEDYFELLKDFEKKSPYLEFSYLEEKLSKCFTSPTKNQDPKLQIMTIHKAKGLEFDTVILLGLERRAPYDKNQLLLWLDRPRSHGENNLILAPIKAKEEEKDRIYDYIRDIEKLKSKHEATRLLYVALTRAKKNLHLIATLNRDSKNPQLTTKPSANSFLHLLWPYAESFFLKKLENFPSTIITTEETKPKMQFLKRLPLQWVNPISFETPAIQQETFQQGLIQNFDQTMKQTGILVHEILRQISLEGLDLWTPEKVMQSLSSWKKQLHRYALSPTAIETSLLQIKMAIENILLDPKGRWILQKHHQAKSEYQLVTHQDNKFKQYAIDRTFIDVSNNVRWIIDYKISHAIHNELNSEILMPYWSQLSRYAFAFSLREDLPIRVGLYFPLTQTWLEKEYISQPITKAADCKVD